MANRQTPLPGANIGLYHHKTGLIPRNIGQHHSGHSVGRKSQNNHNVSNDNQIYKVRHALIWIGTSLILTKRSGHPLTPVRIFRWALPIHSIPRNYHDHWSMVQQLFSLVHPDSGQKPQKRHQWPHGNHPSILPNNRSRSHILHYGATWYSISQATHTMNNHK